VVVGCDNVDGGLFRFEGPSGLHRYGAVNFKVSVLGAKPRALNVTS
jgi:hypothetical protein